MSYHATGGDNVDVEIIDIEDLKIIVDILKKVDTEGAENVAKRKDIPWDKILRLNRKINLIIELISMGFFNNVTVLDQEFYPAS